MKEKQTYKKLKEYGDDMSYENESSITNDDRGKLDLTFLIDSHKREIWEYKQRESQWVLDKNQLDGHKKIVEELSDKLIELTKKQLETNQKLLDAQELNKEHQTLNGKLRVRLTEVEDDNKKLAHQIEDMIKNR